MNSVVSSIAGILMAILLGTSIQSIYTKVKKETVVKVGRGLTPLEGYTRKLTKIKLR